jgi:hypothetical protein
LTIISPERTVTGNRIKTRIRSRKNLTGREKAELFPIV